MERRTTATVDADGNVLADAVAGDEVEYEHERETTADESEADAHDDTYSVRDVMGPVVSLHDAAE